MGIRNKEYGSRDDECAGLQIGLRTVTLCNGGPDNPAEKLKYVVNSNQPATLI
jgi:hypothetical protein